MKICVIISVKATTGCHKLNIDNQNQNVIVFRINNKH